MIPIWFEKIPCLLIWLIFDSRKNLSIMWFENLFGLSLFDPQLIWVKFGQEIFDNYLIWQGEVLFAHPYTDLCLPSVAWQWSVVGYYRGRQLWPRNGTEYSLLCVCLCLTVWLCLKMCSENMVLMRLLQIGAKDLTVIRSWISARLD